MAEGTTVWSNEDRYVSRMNLRYEKLLKKQLAVLEHERNMKTKSLEADKRTFEERIHRLDMVPSNRAHLSQDTHSMVTAEKRKELDRLLKSLMHRPYETRAGYSYIEYLTKNMQPLVKRPLQWGINPPLSPRKEDLPQGEFKKKSERPQLFLTQIEGQTVPLSQRASIPNKQKAKGLVLPPIVSTVKLTNRTVAEKNRLSPSKLPREMKAERRSYNTETLKSEKQRKKSQQMSPKQDNINEKSSPRVKDARDGKRSTAMATLQVPTQTFPSLIDIPKADEEHLDDEEGKGEQDANANSRSTYALSINARLLVRRKSI